MRAISVVFKKLKIAQKAESLGFIGCILFQKDICVVPQTDSHSGNCSLPSIRSTSARVDFNGKVSPPTLCLYLSDKHSSWDHGLSSPASESGSREWVKPAIFAISGLTIAPFGRHPRTYQQRYFNVRGE